MNNYVLAFCVPFGLATTVALVGSAAPRSTSTASRWDASAKPLAVSAALLPPQTQPSCAGTVDGGTHRTVVPSHLFWDQVFEDFLIAGDKHLTVNRDSVGVTAFELIRRRMQDLQSEKATIRATYAAAEARIRDAALAEAVLDARDDLIRSLSDEALLSVNAEAVRANARTFALPVAGRRTATSACQVSIRARQFPHLIPESFYWRFYFAQRAGAAKNFRVLPSGYSPLHIEAVQRQLPLNSHDLTYVIDVATRVTTEIEGLRPDAPYVLGDELAVKGRNELLRALPKETWRLVKADAQRSRGGITMVFPPSRQD